MEKEKPDFIKKLEKKWLRWTSIEDDTVGEALSDLSGNLYHELRKLEAILLTEIERRGIDPTFKDFIKETRTETWKGILSKQNLGMDKVCIIVRNYIEGDNGKQSKKA
jgi:hypothetical protein